MTEDATPTKALEPRIENIKAKTQRLEQLRDLLEDIREEDGFVVMRMDFYDDPHEFYVHVTHKEITENLESLASIPRDLDPSRSHPTNIEYTVEGGMYEIERSFDLW